jgi:hypothetical protein
MLVGWLIIGQHGGVMLVRWLVGRLVGQLNVRLVGQLVRKHGGAMLVNRLVGRHGGQCLSVGLSVGTRLSARGSARWPMLVGRLVGRSWLVGSSAGTVANA